MGSGDISPDTSSMKRNLHHGVADTRHLLRQVTEWCQSSSSRRKPWDRRLAIPPVWNPNGIPSRSPGLDREAGLPWLNDVQCINPNGIVPPRRNPAGVVAPILFLAGWILVFSPVPAISATPLSVSKLQRDTSVGFEKEILPIFQRNCLACHNQTRAKADLVLETPATILKGGATGPAAIPGKAEDSLLFQSAAHRIEDLVMPPVGNKSNAVDLTPDELGLLRLWIDQGAQGEVRVARSLTWQPIPGSWNSSYAVAVDRDGQWVACARANRVQIYDARTGRYAGHLEDPELRGAAQQDIVNAMAFSPSEDVLATAGYREVRLWRRRPPVTREIVKADPGVAWTTAAVSPDRTRIALVTAAGDVQLRRTDTGTDITSWPAVTSTPARIAFSPDATRIAVVGASGTLRILSVSDEVPTHEQALGAEPLALAWFDGGQALATAFHAAKTIQTWRLPERVGATQLVPGSNLTGHDAFITCLATSHSGELVSGAGDGTVLRWATEADTPPTAIQCDGPVTRLDAFAPRARFIASLSRGGSVVLEFGDKPAVTQSLRGDPRLHMATNAVGQDLELARLELGFAEKSAQDAEAETKKATETLEKAREKRDTQAKAFAEKQQSLTGQQKSESDAAKERDDLTAELQRASEEATASEAAASGAQTAAREAADRAVAFQLALEQAERLKFDITRIVESLSGRGEESSLSKAREAAEAVSADAAARARLTSDARSQAEKALEELAHRSFVAGQKNAVADRANTDLPPKKKAAEERIAAAKKAIVDLQPQMEKARIALEGGEKDIQIAEQSANRAGTSLKSARETAETARHRIAQAEERLKERQAEATRAEGMPHAMAHASPSGATLITLNPDGASIAWDVASGIATFAFQSRIQTPLALVALDDHAALVIHPDSITRVDFAPRWDRFRTLGAGAGAGPVSAESTAFADRVNALAFSPDGTFLATGGGEPSRSGELKLWRTIDGTLVRDFGPLHSDCVLSIAFSPRGESLATGGADRFARISDVATGKVLHNLEGHTHHVMAVAWLAHGGTLATGGADGTLKIWNVRTGDRLKNVDGFGKEVTGLGAVGATSQFIAVGGSGQGRVLRENGEKVRDLPGAPSFFQALAMPRDGRWAAVAADDGILRIWDVETAKELFALPPP